MMKNSKMMIGACALAISLGASAQTQYDAARLMGGELNGTARFVGMGGAMGALGGDISVIGTNPAGIGIYRSNDFAVSFGFNNTAAESNFSGTKMKDNRTRASFDQVGFVYSTKIGNNTSLRYINFGFNYHKSKNFNKVFAAGGKLDGLSQTWQMANMFGNAIPGNVSTETAIDEIYEAKNPYDDRYSNYSYLGVMGVRTDLVGINNETKKLIGWFGDQNKYTSREEGGINQYDFNVAFNIEDRVYLGLTLGAYDVNYKRYSYYTEDIFYYPENDPDYGEDVGYYEMTNWFETKGTGIDLKLGVIARPFEDSPFRVGLAVHTPTWYDLTDYHAADLYSNYTTPTSEKPIILEEYTASPEYVGGDTQRDYKLVTPWKFNVSMGTTLEGILALGAEYEYMDYSSAKLKYEDGYEMEDQTQYISEDLKGVHTLRLGMEARLAPAFSVRAGYNYQTAIFKDAAYKALNSNDTRTDTEYNNSKALNTFTFGLGYRGSVIYADLAYKYDMYKSNFYAFDDIDLPATKVDNNRHQLLLTVGARF